MVGGGGRSVGLRDPNALLTMNKQAEIAASQSTVKTSHRNGISLFNRLLGASFFWISSIIELPLSIRFFCRLTILARGKGIFCVAVARAKSSKCSMRYPSLKNTHLLRSRFGPWRYSIVRTQSSRLSVRFSSSSAVRYKRVLLKTSALDIATNRETLLFSSLCHSP